MMHGRTLSALLAGSVLAALLAFAQPTTASAAEGPWIDTTDRAEVLAAYQAEFNRTEPDSGYTGDVDSCTAGTTSQAYRDSVLQRVNWYRRMAGLDVVTERADYTTSAQQSSLMMSAEGSLSHGPDDDWACHTTDGDTAAGKSNLALGINGVGAIDAYVRDPGSNNLTVGHRRTMLYPQLREVGSGDVDAVDGHHAANTLYVFDDNLWAARPSVREGRGFVSWPPSGYVPAEAVWGRWSFSLEGADFSAATVAVSDPAGSVGVEILERIQPDNPSARLAPEPAIVWAVNGDTDSATLPAPDNGDECYTVTVGGVKVSGVTQPNYVYTTCVLDPNADPASAPSGNAVFGDDCQSISFAAWTAPCWQNGGSLGGFVDVNAQWQREPVAWLVGNGITTGVSATRFEPDTSLSRAQAATMIWRLVGSPTPPQDAPRFADVPAGIYYEDAVRWMAGHGITTGTGAGQFSPDATATRAEFVTLLWRLVDKPTAAGALPFQDLTAAWQSPSISWAAATSITTGTSPTTFSPDDTVTRGQAAALLSRFANTLG